MYAEIFVLRSMQECKRLMARKNDQSIQTEHTVHRTTIVFFQSVHIFSFGVLAGDVFSCRVFNVGGSVKSRTHPVMASVGVRVFLGLLLYMDKAASRNRKIQETDARSLRLGYKGLIGGGANGFS